MAPFPIPIRRRILYAGSILLAVGFGLEGLARLMWSDADLVMNPRLSYLQDDPTLLWTLRPYLDMPLDETFQLQTNSLGLRNEEVNTPKPEGTIRVLSLGESTTWGHGVELEESYSKVLEAHLNRDDKRFEVINAGVGGYTTWQSAIYLEERGIDLDPDVVMIYHLKNDGLPRGVVDENNFLYQVRYTDPELYARRKPFQAILSALYHSHLYLRIRQAVLQLPTDLPNFAEVQESAGTRLSDDERRAALRRIEATCRENGIRLVVLMPTYDRHPGHDYVIQDFIRDTGNLLISLPQRKAESNISDDAYYLDEVHPSAQGHALIGQWIFEALEQEGDQWWTRP